jgi:hypothetical protein
MSLDPQQLAAVSRMLSATEALQDLIEVSAEAAGALKAVAIDMRSQKRLQSAAKVQEQADKLERAVIRAANNMRANARAGEG